LKYGAKIVQQRPCAVDDLLRLSSADLARRKDRPVAVID